MTPARPARRLAAWLLDALILGLLGTPLNPLLYSRNPSWALFVGLSVPLMLILFGYLVAFDGGPRGATPGKRIVGTRVVDAQRGGPIGYRRAALRRLVYLLGGLAFYAGWLWLLVDARRQSWHDKAAGSLVVTSR